MSRDLHSATATALDASTIYPAWLIRLDIKDDPVFVWTGLGPIVFTGTGDTALDGFVFDGVASAGTISSIVDAANGSQAVTLQLAGVDLNDATLRQVVFDENVWQARAAWMWLVLFDSTGTMIGAPTRVKTGRMDQMTVEDQADNTGAVNCQIESQQAYASEALYTRYSEQTDYYAADISQAYVWDLANQAPVIGQANTTPASASTSSSLSAAFFNRQAPQNIAADFLH